MAEQRQRSPVDGAPDLGGTELFRSPNLLVRLVGRDRSSICVVTFTSFIEPAHLGRSGFGESFFADRGIDAVHVTCADNRWYQYAEWPDALERIRCAVRPYVRVLAYGSSMGGYAAVRYGGQAGAHEALAISPQFSVDGRLVPFEHRWRRVAARIRFLHEGGPITLPRATIVYDPRDVDGFHVDLFAAALPVRRIPLIHAGHPAGAYLAETGLLTDLVLSLCEGRVDPDYGRRARAARRRSGQYLFTLARRVPARRAAVRRALVRSAIDVVPEEPVYHSYLGHLLDDDDRAAAEQAHRRALALAPTVPLFLARLARHLLRLGRIAEGVDVAETLHAMMPEDPSTVRLRVVALLLAGRPGPAAGLFLAAAKRGRLSLGVVRDCVRLALWKPAGSQGWQHRWRDRRRDSLPLQLGQAGTPPHVRPVSRR